MLKVSAARYVRAAHYLGTMTELATRVHQGPGDDPKAHAEARAMLAREGEIGRLKGEMLALRTDCEVMDLPLTIKHLDRFTAFPELTAEVIFRLFSDIHLRFHDELDMRVIYGIEANRAQFYEKPLDGWQRVIDRFKCAFDVEEARKCFALERYTAAVFHLMKVVESAVLELQLFLRDEDVKAHFGSVVSKLEDMTQKQKYEHVDANLKPYLSFMREVLSQLHAVKDSWRNKVSHVDTRILPEGTFTEELARGIHDATLLLMSKLVEGLPPSATA